MTIPTLLQWLLTSAGLFISIFALFVALHSSDRSLSKRLSAHSTQLQEQQATLDELSAQLKALRQRENMRAYRRRRGGESNEDEQLELSDGRSWVQNMNEKLARARLGVPR